MVSKMSTMYETDRPSTLINDTRWLLHFGSWSRVRSAMPNTVYGRIYSRMTSYLKIFATRRTNLKIFPSGCPQLPEIQNTKVPSYQNCSVFETNRRKKWRGRAFWPPRTLELSRVVRVGDGESRGYYMEGNFLSRYNNKLTGRRVWGDTLVH